MISRILKNWILVVFVTTGLAGTIYLAVQQNYRQSANDPQIQMAEDLHNYSQNSRILNFKELAVSNPIDISKSLAPFIIIYDENGTPSESKVTINGEVPKLAQGVFDYVNVHGEDRITWEPKSGVRIAAIIEHFTIENSGVSGYELVGRNLREVEKRIDMLTLQIGAGWAATVIGSLVLITVLEFIFPHYINKK